MHEEPLTGRPRLRLALLVAACLLGVAVNAVIYLPGLRYIADGANDFVGFYAGAKLAGTGSLYDAGEVAKLEAPLTKTPLFLAFVRFPSYALLLAPLRFFPYLTAYRVWQAASLLAVAGFVVWWPYGRRWLAALACCWSLPLFNCFVMGQDIALMVAFLAAGLALSARGRYFAGGCAASLCLIKYNLFAPLVLLVLARRWWRFGGGMAAGLGVSLAVSFLAAGWNWPREYLAILQLPTTTPRFGGMPNLHGLFSSNSSHLLWEAAASCAVLGAAWFVMQKSDTRRAIAAALVAGLLLSYHGFLADAYLLVPAALLMLDSAATAAEKVTAVLLLCPVPWVPFIGGGFYPPALIVVLPMVVLAVTAWYERRGTRKASTVSNPAVKELP